jgi:hypothetical protein
MAQTQLWTDALEQPFVGCGMQQEELAGHAPQSAAQLVHVSVPLHEPSPHTGPALQLPHPRLVTSLTHSPSQELLQQKGSEGHTHASTDSTSQPGLPWVAQQSPVHDPHWSDSCAHRLSHCVLQQ